MKVTITIECTPKKGRADKLHTTLWAVVKKHTKHGQPRTIHTDYHQEEAQ